MHLAEMKMEEVAKQLQLQPHPEGGFYRETYRSSLKISANNLSTTFTSERNVATAIYFLIGAENFSAFHRILSDEMWHYYAGAPLHIHQIQPDGVYKLTKLGLAVEEGYEPQAVVPARHWFASECATSDSWSLVGCTVSPGFDFMDFEIADRGSLIKEFPQHRSLITRLTR